MPTEPQAAPVSNKVLWTGRILSWLPALFLLFGGVMDLVQPPSFMQDAKQMGYPESVFFGLGIALLLSTILYLIPRTAVLGAILLTGYLGGAVATHVRMLDFPHLPGAIVFAVLLWGGLWLRDRRLRALVPLRS